MAKRGPKGPSKYTEQFLDIEAVALEAYAESSNRPLVEEFATRRGYYSQVIWNEKFSERSAKFGFALKRFKDIQKVKWLELALTTKNQAAAIFTLKNVSDMRDEQYLRAEGLDTKQIVQVYLPNGINGKQNSPQVDASSRPAGTIPLTNGS